MLKERLLNAAEDAVSTKRASPVVRESGSTERVAVEVDAMVYCVCASEEEDVDDERGERRSRFVSALWVPETREMKRDETEGGRYVREAESA